MHTLTYDESSVTFNTGFLQSRRIKSPKAVLKLLIAMHVQDLPTIQARRVFENVCQFYATRKRMDLVLSPGQKVRHIVRYDGMSSTRVATFQDGFLLWNNLPFKSLSAFAQTHYRDAHPKRTTANGWVECQALVGDKWFTLMQLRNAFFR